MKYFFIFIFTIISISSDTYAQNIAPQTPHNPLVFGHIAKSTGFSLPLDCQIGENCWIMNYVDMLPNDGKATDSACFSRTYDAHKGTDFAILDGKTMEQGVDVLAALDGTVAKIRDGAPDQWSTQEQLDAIKAERKECGNAIMINHDNGIQTLYCHLKKNSITVKPNQPIKAGDKIGQVGLSGLTQFPHLHFGVLKNNKVIDPFTGNDNTTPCGNKIKSLWKREIDLNYQPFDIQSGGFLDKIPDLKEIERDAHSKTETKPNTDILTFWTTLLGVREDDTITLEIKDPNGKTFAKNEISQEETNIKQFYYIGKKLNNTRLREGVYTGRVEISRTDKQGKETKKDKIFTLLVSK